LELCDAHQSFNNEIGNRNYEKKTSSIQVFQEEEVAPMQIKEQETN
jgi:hypothetical protein